MVLISRFSTVIVNCGKTLFLFTSASYIVCKYKSSQILLNIVFGSHSVVNGQEHSIIVNHILYYECEDILSGNANLELSKDIFGKE